MQISDLIPDAEQLQVEIEAIPEPQRVALALQLIKDISVPCCALSLMRLSNLAEDHYLSIRREAFVQDNARRGARV